MQISSIKRNIGTISTRFNTISTYLTFITSTIIDKKSTSLFNILTINEINDIISTINSPKDKLDNIIEKINNLKNNTHTITKNASDHFINLINSELTFIEKTTSPIKSFELYYSIDNEKKTVRIKNADSATHSLLTSHIQLLINAIKIADEKLSNFDYMYRFKSIDRNIVIIGSNGSGKSTFSRSIKKAFGNNIAIISAQKILTCNDTDSIPLGNKLIEQVYTHQNDEKLFKNKIPSTYSSDFQTCISALIADHTKLAFRHYEEDINSHEQKRKGSILEIAIRIWNEIIPHRSLRFDIEKGSLTVTHHNHSQYSIQDLSDGEKAVLYYTAHVLLSKPDCYIIIDEPENHLNASIVSHLWDSLEATRSDCRFIYLTHNLDFATSRKHCVKLWNKSYRPPNEWEIIDINEDEFISEELLMTLFGSRKSILFCEGEKGSLDYKLYSTIFQNYHISPVGGHLDVINHTKSFNKLSHIHGNKSIGIIDGDFHLPNQIIKWQDQNIYCINTNEVENLLCDEMLITKAAESFYADESSITYAKNKLFEKLDTEKTKQSLLKTTQDINTRLKENMLKNHSTIYELEKEISNLATLIKPKEIYDKNLKKLEEISNNKDYSEGIKRYSNKGLTGLLTCKISNDYQQRIIKLLTKDKELRDAFLDKHFHDVPKEK